MTLEENTSGTALAEGADAEEDDYQAALDLLESYSFNTLCCASTHKRLDNLERLTESVHTIAIETKAMREDFNKLDERVEEIEHLPGKRYNLIITTIITSSITAIVGFVIGNLINLF